MHIHGHRSRTARATRHLFSIDLLRGLAAGHLHELQQILMTHADRCDLLAIAEEVDELIAAGSALAPAVPRAEV